jgi:hypothetical protein
VGTRPTAGQILRVHRPLFDGLLRRVLESHDRLLTWLLFAAFVTGIFLPELADLVRRFVLHVSGEAKWNDMTRVFAVFPLAFLIAWKLMEANAERVIRLESDATIARTELERNYRPRLRPRVSQVVGALENDQTRITFVTSLTNEGADTSVIELRVAFLGANGTEVIPVVHPLGEHFQVTDGMKVDCSAYLPDRIAPGIKRGQTIWGRFSCLMPGNRLAEVDAGGIFELAFTDHLGVTARLGTVRLKPGGGSSPQIQPSETPIITRHK